MVSLNSCVTGFENGCSRVIHVCPQDHYDFGMRAVKTVIAVAGNLKRERPGMAEPLIVLRAIRDVNVPKFLREDLKLFNGTSLGRAGPGCRFGSFKT